MSVTYSVLLHAAPTSPFPITNIPFGIFSTTAQPTRRAAIAIGKYLLDISLPELWGIFRTCFSHEPPQDSIFAKSSLNVFAALPADTRASVRNKIRSLLQDQSSVLFTNLSLNEKAFHKLSAVEMHLPMDIGDFTDFMCSKVHVDNCSRMAGVSAPLSFQAFPSAYNGRASSVVPSGTPIVRPRGMLKVPGTSNFDFKPSSKMDYELEMGFFVSEPLAFGNTIGSADEAREHIFGFVMLNDWSARDIQFAEMTPLGPFNGKGSGTTISPWVVTLDALDDAKVASSDSEALQTMEDKPSHLRHRSDKYTWNIDVEVALKGRGLTKPKQIGAANLRNLYWSPAQMLSHHASSGCGLRTGDLLGTGTISGSVKMRDAVSSLGCLYEATEGGTKPLTLASDNAVTWIEDGDEIIMTGRVMNKDGSEFGFGECRGVLQSPGHHCIIADSG